MHQNFKAIAGLNYRFIGYLYVLVFSMYKTGIMTTSNDFTIQALAGVVKKVCLAFSLVHTSFSKNLVYLAYAEIYFSTKFYFLLNIIRSLSIS